MPRRTQKSILSSPEWEWWQERLDLLPEDRQSYVFERIMGVLEPFEIAKNNYEKASKDAALKEEYESRERGVEWWREQMEMVRKNHLYGDAWQKVGWVEPEGDN